MSIYLEDDVYYRKTDDSKWKWLLEKWSHLITPEEVEEYILKSNETQSCNLFRKYPEFLFMLKKEHRIHLFIETVIKSRPTFFEKLEEYEKTESLCILAIEMNSSNIKYVPEKIKTNEFTLSMIKKRWHTISSIENPTEEMYLLAISINPWAIYYVKEKTEKMMLAAKKAPGLYKKNNMPQFYNAVLAYVKEYGYALQYIRKELKTYELCKAAVEKEPGAVKYIKKSMLEEYPELNNKVEEKDLRRLTHD